MDAGWPAAVWVGIAIFQVLLIINALSVSRVAQPRAV
jgi:hypothetical protein